jgi:ATP-dependent helicase/nuclease subunit B
LQHEVSGIERHFIGWDLPLLNAATTYLTQAWQGGLLDLSHLLVVVPTLHAGRRLREQLAHTAAIQNAAVLPPRTVTPDVFLQPPPQLPPIAAPHESLAAWIAILNRIDLEDFSALFPVQPSRRDFQWAFGIANSLITLRRDLGEHGLGLAEAADALPEDAEVERWQDLARLEHLYLAQLNSLALQDLEVCKRRQAEAPSVPAGVQAVVIMGVPDPLPLAVTAWQNLAAQMPVIACIHAPHTMAAMFDAVGRPLPESWQNFPLEIPDSVISLCANPAAQTQRILEDMAALPLAHVAVGVPDSELLPSLEKALPRLGVPSFNPAGHPLGDHVITGLLRCLIRLLRDPSYDRTAAVLRHPDFLEYLAKIVPGFQPEALMTELDKYQNAHLPASFAQLRQRFGADSAASPLASAVQTLEHWLELLQGDGSTAQTLAEFFSAVYEHCKLRGDLEEDRLFCEAAGIVTEELNLLESPVLSALGLTGPDQLDLLLHSLEKRHLYPERAANAIDLLGWLELAWENAPHLFVAGFNDGLVPETMVDDMFLPDKLRAALGLRCNRTRGARDTFQLQSLLASRRTAGSLHLLLGKTSTGGDPLKPSRLLFHCPDEKLPIRAATLFGEVHVPAESMMRTPLWPLQPPAVPIKNTLSVTAFRDYLACPFRFYLKRGLRMEELDDRKTEMDAMDFGNICHYALQQFGLDQTMRDCEDREKLATFLGEQAASLVCRQYGTRPPVPVVIQLEAAKQRLGAFAARQVEEYRAGWRIIHVEYEIGGPDGLEFCGFRIRGKVDRVDRHANGRLRILDYKTSDHADQPEAKHLKNAPAERSLPDYAYLEGGKKTRQWLDLQLPLYSLLLQPELGDTSLCGYVSLPKAVSQTQFLPWELTPDLLASARDCASGILADIARYRFWPPTERLQYDDFAGLFFDTPEESVDAAGFQLALSQMSHTQEGR